MLSGLAPLYAASDAVSAPWAPWPLMVPTQNGDTRSHGLVIRRSDPKFH